MTTKTNKQIETDFKILIHAEKCDEFEVIHSNNNIICGKCNEVIK